MQVLPPLSSSQLHSQKKKKAGKPEELPASPANIAALIAGSDETAAGWLRNVLPDLIVMVRQWRRGREVERIASRKAMRGKLEGVEQHAKALARLLGDEHVRLFVANGAGAEIPVAIEALVAMPGEPEPSLVRRLRALPGWAREAEKAIPSAGPVTEAWAMRGGRAVPAPLAAERVAGVVVFELWRAVRGRLPDERTEPAQDAVLAIWRAVGGAELSPRAALRDARLNDEPTRRWRQRVQNRIEALKTPTRPG